MPLRNEYPIPQRVTYTGHNHPGSHVGATGPVPGEALAMPELMNRKIPPVDKKTAIRSSFIPGISSRIGLRYATSKVSDT